MLGIGERGYRVDIGTDYRWRDAENIFIMFGWSAASVAALRQPVCEGERVAMAECQAIYKCRLCGEEYCGERVSEETIAISYNTPITVDGNKIFGMCLHGTHNCDDGSLGLSDFQGFRRFESVH